MRRIRLLTIGLFSVIGVIFGGSFFKKALSIFLCSLLGFNSISGIPFLSDDSRVNAAFVPTKRESTTIVAPNTLKNPGVIGEIPRIRKAELQLPGDFQLVSQMPFSSGRREIVLISSSTGVEQVYTTTLAGEENFQLFSIEYKKVAGIDLRPLFVGKNIQGDTTEIESLLKQFKIFFKDSLVSKIVLADGSSVELNGNEAVIKSPKGQVLEKIMFKKECKKTQKVKFC